MSREPTEAFFCPNCLQLSPKGRMVLMMQSDVAVTGSGVNWSGNLEKELPRVARVRYCSRCKKPVDFHAVLRGHLDEARYPKYIVPGIGISVFFGCLKLLLWSWWAAAGIAIISGIVAYKLCMLIESWRVKRYRLTAEDAKRLEAEP